MKSFKLFRKMLQENLYNRFDGQRAINVLGQDNFNYLIKKGYIKADKVRLDDYLGWDYTKPFQLTKYGNFLFVLSNLDWYRSYFLKAIWNYKPYK